MAITKALALLATQGGLSNLLRGLGGVLGNQVGSPPMSNSRYPGQAVNYGRKLVQGRAAMLDLNKTKLTWEVHLIRVIRSAKDGLRRRRKK